MSTSTHNWGDQLTVLRDNQGIKGGISQPCYHTNYNTKLKQFLIENSNLNKAPDEGVCAVLLPEAENVCASRLQTDPPKEQCISYKDTNNCKNFKNFKNPINIATLGTHNEHNEHINTYYNGNTNDTNNSGNVENSGNILVGSCDVKLPSSSKIHNTLIDEIQSYNTELFIATDNNPPSNYNKFRPPQQKNSQKNHKNLPLKGLKIHTKKK